MSRAALFRRKASANSADGPIRIDGEHSTYPEALSMKAIIGSAWLRRLATVLLFVFVVAGAASVFGVSESTVSASGAGYELEVRYAEVSRPGLETPWSATVTKPGGFDGPVTLRVSAGYFEQFDVNAINPAPDAMRRDDANLVLEFARPAGEVLAVSIDARLSPATQSSANATAALVDGGAEVATVDFKTTVMP